MSSEKADTPNNSQDLITIKTDKFQLYIKGEPNHPRVNYLRGGELAEIYQSLLQVEPVNCQIESFTYYDPQDPGRDYLQTPGEKVFPLFYEEQEYQILIEGRNGVQPQFFHENKNLRQAVTPLPGQENALWGSLNFRSDVGYSELVIKTAPGNAARQVKPYTDNLTTTVSGQTLLILRIEVFPTKIDYRSDYQSLLEDVNRKVYNLAYDFLRRTFQDMQIKEADQISDAEFFSIIQQIFQDFRQAFTRIEQSPHHELQKKRQVLPAARVKQVDRESLKWLRKNPEVYDQDLELPVRMLNIARKIKIDTFENRFLRWIMEELITRITTFKRRYRSRLGEDNLDPRVISRADEMIAELDRFLQQTFLTEVGQLHQFDSLSLVLQLAPGYREIYRYYLMLIKGLALNGELFRLSMKQLWQLYEYWCYLELNSILQEKYKLIKSNLIDFDYSGIYVTLNTGRQARVRYQHPTTGEQFSLIYNKKFPAGDKTGLTTSQQPDNVLALNKTDIFSDIEYNFVFDAKYRLDPGDANRPPGPEEETINTMHRYRDAIIHRAPDAPTGELANNLANNLSNSSANDLANSLANNSAGKASLSENSPGDPPADSPGDSLGDSAADSPGDSLGDSWLNNWRDNFKRRVVGAFVLFPYDNEERFRQHRFYRSIKQVNVGALPFLPNHTELVEEMLEEIIEESALTSYERHILPEGSQSYQQALDFKQDVLVGSLGSCQQLDFCLANNLYYLPFSESILNQKLDYLAIYQSQRRFGEETAGIKYYAAIEQIQVKKRSEIPFPESQTLNKNRQKNRQNSSSNDSKNNDYVDNKQSLSGKTKENYFVFSLSDWQQLPNNIKPEGYGVQGSHIYTNFMLLQKASTLPELSIKSLREWRLWLELKRLKREIKVVLDETGQTGSSSGHKAKSGSQKDIVSKEKTEIKFKTRARRLSKLTNITGFADGDVTISVEREGLKVNGSIIKFVDFLHNPRRGLKKIFSE